MTRHSEQHIYERQGFGQVLGLKGRMALCLVDFVNGFNDPQMFGGGNIADAIRTSVPVLDYFRNRGSADRPHPHRLRRRRVRRQSLHRQGARPARAERGRAGEPHRPGARAAAGRTGDTEAAPVRLRRHRLCRLACPARGRDACHRRLHDERLRARRRRSTQCPTVFGRSCSRTASATVRSARTRPTSSTSAQKYGDVISSAAFFAMAAEAEGVILIFPSWPGLPATSLIPAKP